MNLICFHVAVVIVGIAYLVWNKYALTKNEGFKQFAHVVGDPIALETNLVLYKTKLVSRVITGVLAYSYMMFSVFRVLEFFQIWTLEVIVFFIMLCLYVFYTVSHIRAVQTIHESTL